MVAGKPDLEVPVAATPDLDVLPALYSAEVVHSRFERLRRSFSYRIRLWLVDLDDLPVLPWWLRPFVRFDAADHLGVPDRSIRENVDRWLATQGVDLRGGQIVMLAGARSIGYVFNPITLFWCSLPDGSPEYVIAEVHNTYGGRHCYLLRPDSRDVVRTAKEFYVSPFLAVDGEYEMRVSRPGQDLAVAVSLRRQGETLFAVTLRGVRQPVSRRRIVLSLLANPLGSYRVSALIRWHGIRLWLRRIPVQARKPHVAQKGVQ